MGRAVCFRTPGLIDTRSFTTFGLNAKPNSANPIGFFGTGLKYAVAVLCRLGSTPRLFIGRDEHLFYVRPTDFRGKEFGAVRMRRKRWSLLRATHHELPFTTELGKTWQAWQAFRELESNTRDEGGETFLMDGVDADPALAEGDPDHTLIIVESEEFVQAFLERDETFLPGGLSVREDADAVQVLDRPTRRLYYRGLRVRDLEKPALYTYNLLAPSELTEDRTLKYEWEARSALARHVVSSHDAQFIEAVLTAPEDNWEHHLDMSSAGHYQPSPEFLAVAARRQSALTPSARRYYSSWTTGSATRPLGSFDVHPRPWVVGGDGGWLSDANGEMVLCGGTGLSKVLGAQVMQEVADLVNRGVDGDDVP
jgi:hypothetical protein